MVDCVVGALIAAMLTTGAINTLTKKFQFTACAPTLDHHTGDGCPDGEDVFNKPWSQNNLMFLGEAMCILVFLAQVRRGAVRRPDVSFLIFALPCMCDIMGTGLGGVGMGYKGVSASFWQMMRGSIVLFTSTLSVLFLGKKLYLYNWVGVGITIVGLVIVGLAAIVDEGGLKGGAETLIGVAFIVCAQFFSAVQMVVEEKLCKSRDCPPAQIVGSEGVWGLIFMPILLFVFYQIPGSDVGNTYENGLNSLYMLGHVGPLDAFVLSYLVSIGFYNFLGVTVTHRLSAVHRTIIDALRTCLVIVVDLVVYHISPRYGTPWRAHTWLQLVGFVFLVTGAVTYHGVLKWPCFYYPPKPPTLAASPTVDKARLLMSPNDKHAPLMPDDVELEGS